MSVREDPFSGEARPRLGRIARDLDAVVTDAQSRDWAADRGDRLMFARLGEVRDQVWTAAGRGRWLPRITDPVAVLVGVTVWLLVTGATLWISRQGAPADISGTAAGISGTAAENGGTAADVGSGWWATGSGGLVLLVLAVVVGLWAGMIAVVVLRRLRRRWDRLDPDGVAPIDDPYRYAAFRRRIEACAAGARGHRSRRRRAGAIDLEHALDWLSAAQSELPRR